MGAAHLPAAAQVEVREPPRVAQRLAQLHVRQRQLVHQVHLFQQRQALRRRVAATARDAGPLPQKPLARGRRLSRKRASAACPPCHARSASQSTSLTLRAERLEALTHEQLASDRCVSCVSAARCRMLSPVTAATTRP